MASLKTEVAAIPSLSLLYLLSVTCTLWAHPHPSALSCFIPAVPSSGRWHISLSWQCQRPVRSAQHSRCSPGNAEEVPSLNSHRIFLKQTTAFLCEPCPVDGSVGCFLLNRETKPLLNSPRDLSNVTSVF